MTFVFYVVYKSITERFFEQQILRPTFFSAFLLSFKIQYILFILNPIVSGESSEIYLAG